MKVTPTMADCRASSAESGDAEGAETRVICWRHCEHASTLDMSFIDLDIVAVPQAKLRDVNEPSVCAVAHTTRHPNLLRLHRSSSIHESRLGGEDGPDWSRMLRVGYQRDVASYACPFSGRAPAALGTLGEDISMAIQRTTSWPPA